MLSSSDIIKRLRNKKRKAYKKAFSSHEGKIVLNDLRNFCGATKSSYDPSHQPHEAVYAEGQRSVWLQIMKYLHLTDEEVLKLREEIFKNLT